MVEKNFELPPLDFETAGKSTSPVLQQTYTTVPLADPTEDSYCDPFRRRSSDLSQSSTLTPGSLSSNKDGSWSSSSTLGAPLLQGENDKIKEFGSAQALHDDLLGHRGQRPVSMAMSMMSRRESLSKWRFGAIFASLCMVVFLFALDQLIVATAMEKITAEFDSLSQLSWIASGYFLTLLSFNLLYSQANNIFPSKHVMILAVVLFEAGSVICAASPNITILILGRCISGCGAAGVFGSGMLIITELTTLSERPKYFAGFGICFGIACVVGPVLGGFLADNLSWRWCFWINLPLGGVALICLAIMQPAHPPLGLEDTYQGYSKAMLYQLIRCDWPGVCISTAWGSCWILALQWAGVTRDWDDPTVLTTLVFSGVLPVAFCLYEWAMKDYGYFRIRLLKRRTIAGAGIVSFFMFGLYMALVYYLSLTYQAVHHTTATGSGLRLLPLIITEVIFLVLSSFVIPIIGRFKMVIVIGPVFLVVATCLFSTIEYSTSMWKLYGYQILLGVGLGCCLQNIMVAVQNELRKEPELISLGTGLVVFLGFSGRIMSLSMAGSIFENMIQRNLKNSVPGITIEMIAMIMNDATAVWSDQIPADYRTPILEQYTKTLGQVYSITIPMAVLALAGALLMKNSKVIGKQQEQLETWELETQRRESRRLSQMMLDVEGGSSFRRSQLGTMGSGLSFVESVETSRNRVEDGEMERLNYEGEQSGESPHLGTGSEQTRRASHVSFAGDAPQLLPSCKEAPADPNSIVDADMDKECNTRIAVSIH